MKAVTPLNALRAFEVAARTGSFANAAREMGVSSAAVSQQVKILEEFWGKLLFIRQGNRITLTDAGLTAYPVLGQSMEALEDLSNIMRRTERKKRIVVSAPQSVATTWLAAKLARLENLEQATPFDIRVAEDPVDFVQDKIDMRIFYGHDLYGDYQVEKLFSDVLVAVASPGFVSEHGQRVDHIEDRHLIHTDWGRDYSTSPNWNSAFDETRVVDHNAGLRVETSSTAITFAMQGFGVALVPAEMVDMYLSSGAIRKLDLDPIAMGHEYRIAFPKRLVANSAIQSLLKVFRASM
ncbi:MAG: LysR substrate-binding domain-containing protein [Rhizobiaceae bacterium]